MLRLVCLLLLLSIEFGFGQGVSPDKTYSITYDSTQNHIPPITNTRQLIKAGVGLPLLRQSSVSSASYWKSIGLDITAEHKIKGGLALIGGIETNYCFSKHAQLYSLEMPIGLRYYFSLGKKMNRRADPHGFFSHYISFQTYNVLFSSLFYDTPNPNAERYYRGEFLDHKTNVGKYDERLNMLQYAYFQIGSQLKLGQTHCLDINAVIPLSQLIYHKAELALSSPSYITIKYGIAWPK